MEATDSIKPILSKLLTPEQAAQLFQSAHPGLAVFSHIVKKDLPGRTGDQVILRRTRAAGYSGPLRMGLDGMRITIGARILVHPAQPRSGLPDFDGPGSKY
jgi:ribonuclease Z